MPRSRSESRDPAASIAVSAQPATPARRASRACLVALSALVVAAASCGRNDDRLIEHRLYAMATWVDITLPARATREHPELIAEIEAELNAFGRDYYAWGQGELARLNAALSAGQGFDASPGLAAVLSRALELARASGGAFDPGVGGLVELYGLHDAAAAGTPPPDDAAIDAELAAAGSILDLEIAGTRIAAPRIAAPGIAAPGIAAPGIAAPPDDGTARHFTLDLGGIAKGSAVDRIAERLIDLDIAPALVNAGGNLRVVGERPDRPWRIGIRDPRAEALLGAIELRDGDAVSTSGDYERYRESDGGRLHHIIDPRTGRPVAHTMAVTVIAADAETADAASTALFVAGPDLWFGLARLMGAPAALRVDASGRIEMTPAMRDRFEAGTSGDSAIITAVD